MNDSKPCLYVMYIDDVRGGSVQAQDEKYGI